MHDDVVDESDERRGSASASKAFGNKMAILAGDFLFTRALLLLTSEIRNGDVTADISRSMENLVKGEILQMAPYKNLHIGKDAYDPKNTELENKLLKMYEIKTYHKTASLFSYMCTSVARIVLQEQNHQNGTNGVNGSKNGSKHDISDDDLLYHAAAFGRQFGMAFQIVDDLLDYDQECADLGKPVGQDMKLGLATLPVILASRRYPMKLRPLILRNFAEEGDIDTAMHVLRNEDKNKAFEESQQYVEKHIQRALTALFHLPDCAARNALIKVTCQYQHRKQ
jgi:hexaprenyl-diphosphate synthase